MKWKGSGVEQKYGTSVGERIDGKCLTHVAFVDDVTLVAQSWTTPKIIVLELGTCLAKYGLNYICKNATSSATRMFTNNVVRWLLQRTLQHKCYRKVKA